MNKVPPYRCSSRQRKRRPRISLREGFGKQKAGYRRQKEIMAVTQSDLRITHYALRIDNLSAWYGKFQAVRDVSMEVARNRIMGLVGPSGSGKSTVLRCLNRMHETLPGARVA